MSKRITILGGGESGVGAALLGGKIGYKVLVSDAGTLQEHFRAELQRAGIAVEEGGHSQKVFAADLVVKSPGIPRNTEVVLEAVRKGIEVVSEVEFAYRHTTSKIIGITGTNGKTTTTSLIYHLLEAGGLDVAACGNIGSSMARRVAEKDYEWLVVELSSFQLDDIKEFHPNVAILLNITPDHLNRYADFDEYVAAKWRIFENMTDADSAIYWADDPVITSRMNMAGTLARQVGVSLVNGEYSKVERGIQLGKTRINKRDIPLTGDHNMINVMAASAAAIEAGLSAKSIKQFLQSFRGVPHRMEFIDEIDGVRFINDSKATNVDAVYYALDAYKGPITWIAGGQDKGNDYTRIKPLVAEKVKSMVCLGVDNEKLMNAFLGIPDNMSETRDVNEATRTAFHYSSEKDVVLLSPACASFDLFNSYEDRGEQFRKAVQDLKSEVEQNPGHE